jgi:hypothetical protein
MRKLIPLLVGGAMLASPALANPDGEAQLERALEGRVAGTPVDCISMSRMSSSQIIDDTAILYRVGSTIYVNRPRAGTEQLNRFDTMVNRLTGSNQLCSIDTVRTVDLTTGVPRGVILLGEFVPYRRAGGR